jgi:hypothetical protein
MPVSNPRCSAPWAAPVLLYSPPNFSQFILAQNFNPVCRAPDACAGFDIANSS